MLTRNHSLDCASGGKNAHSVFSASDHGSEAAQLSASVAAAISQSLEAVISSLQAEVASLKASMQAQISSVTQASSDKLADVLLTLKVKNDGNAAHTSELATLNAEHRATLTELEQLKSLYQYQTQQLGQPFKLAAWRRTRRSSAPSTPRARRCPSLPIRLPTLPSSTCLPPRRLLYAASTSSMATTSERSTSPAILAFARPDQKLSYPRKNHHSPRLKPLTLKRDADTVYEEREQSRCRDDMAIEYLDIQQLSLHRGESIVVQRHARPPTTVLLPSANLQLRLSTPFSSSYSDLSTMPAWLLPPIDLLVMRFLE